ncbi:unnamed protein product [Thelazia callipaeda]|uniref:WH2 domain-containing protein n=1 Tax=Thelazia callipaeda TaxID=103827 RepID=A0A0N5CXY4_THECL|nr:unnamed protein product [Thelazia callipaeda]
MSGSWNSDAMVNSQTTYTVSGSADRSHYQLLEEIECPSELIEVDDDMPYPQLSSNLVLESSEIGVTRLPTAEDDLSTPLVEYNPYNDAFHQYEQQQHHDYILHNYTEEYSIHQQHTNNAITTEPVDNLQNVAPSVYLNEFSAYKSLYSQLPQSQQHDHQYPADALVFDRVLSSMSTDSTVSDITADATHLLLHQLPQNKKQTLLSDTSFPELSNAAMTSAEALKRESQEQQELNRSFTVTKESSPKGHEYIKSSAKGKIESLKKEEIKERPRKPRPPSIREIQNAPIPTRPAKLKPPSKSQLMMEQLKASIEADKLKPKKDVKSKLHEILSAPPPIRSTQLPQVLAENKG